MQTCVLIGDRNDLVATAYGHSVGFRAGQPTEVPNVPAVIKACLDRGHKRPAVPAPVLVQEPEPVQEVVAEVVEPTPAVTAPARRGRAKSNGLA